MTDAYTEIIEPQLPASSGETQTGGYQQLYETPVYTVMLSWFMCTLVSGLFRKPTAASSHVAITRACERGGIKEKQFCKFVVFDW